MCYERAFRVGKLLYYGCVHQTTKGADVLSKNAIGNRMLSTLGMWLIYWLSRGPATGRTPATLFEPIWNIQNNQLSLLSELFDWEAPASECSCTCRAGLLHICFTMIGAKQVRRERMPLSIPGLLYGMLRS